MTAAEPSPSDNDSYLVYIPSIIFLAISPIVVLLRVWARLRQGGSMGADDWTAIVALVFTLLTTILLMICCHYGMGRHFKFIEHQNQIETLKFLYMSQISYKAAINLTKCSILLLYLRLFEIVSWMRWACRGLLACVIIYCISSMTATIFQCSPVAKAFDKGQAGTCINLASFWFANAGFSIATDVVILLIPMPLVYQLEVPRPQKVALVAVFAVGVFVVITSCLRVTTLDVFATSTDNTYDIANVMWTIIEPNVAIVCACLPTLRQLVIKLFPALGSKSSANRYGTPGYDSNGYNSKSRGSRVTGRRSQKFTDEWVEPGAKSNGIHMATIRRNNSNTGSEESILAGAQDDANNGIKRTMEYSIQYSEKKLQM